MVNVNSILSYLKRRHYNVEYIGNPDIQIDGFSSLNNYIEGTLTWIKTQDAYDEVGKYKNITLAIVQEGIDVEINNAILTSNSKQAFFDILDQLFVDKITENTPVGSGTYISPNVKIGNNVVVGHNCTIDGNIEIGDGTIIHNNVNMINSIRIGKNCVIQSGVNLGHDGFSFTEDTDHKKHMIKHYGGIQIGNNVYIGGNSCIERGTLDNTVIEDGVKIDVMCTIGHNSIIRKNSALVAGTVLFGSVSTGENVYFASALVKNQCHIADNSLVGMGSVVIDNVDSNQVVIGVPAKPRKKIK